MIILYLSESLEQSLDIDEPAPPKPKFGKKKINSIFFINYKFCNLYGFGPPVNQSRSSIVCIIGILVPVEI